MAAARKKLAIIDGKSVFYRGYYAMPGLTTADGTPTGGVYGFATLAIQLMKQLKPDYVAVAWDKPKTNIRKRKEIYPKYKAGRKPAPPDFYAQIPILQELLGALGWPLYECDDYEADDIMATLAKVADTKNIETELVTSDLDALQAISPLTHVYVLKKGLTNIERFHPESFTEKYGIRVDQFLDLKSLRGDSSDNIPGVPGIGEKTALLLLGEYETLDGIYKNLAHIKESVRKKLEAGKDSAYMSKEIARLWVDAPVVFNEKELDGSKIDVTKLKELLEKLEFRTLIRQLPDYLKDRGDGSSATSFAAETQPHGKVKNTLVTTVNTLPKLDLKAKEVVMYVRCSKAHGQGLQYLIISPDAKTSYTMVVGKNLSEENLATWLKPYLDDISIVGHDVKQVLKTFIHLSLPLPPLAHDIHLGAFMLNPLLRSQDLGAMLDRAFGYGAGIDTATTEDFPEYISQVVSGIWAMTTRQRDELKLYPKMITLAKNIEWPIVPVLADMEVTGIELNTTYLNKMSEEFEGLISDIEQQIYGHANQEFNISSPAQLSVVLFEDMKLPVAGIKKGKSAYSTAAGELDKLRWTHPIINLITQYREYTKLKSTYVDSLPKLVDEQSRLHTTFNLTIAQTGRLSSADPNLQNIPVRTEIGKKIRGAFRAGKDKVLVSADYSQFELRLAAAMAHDTELVELFNKDADIHTETAAQVYNIKPHEVTPEQRRHAKVINFGILYGMSPHGLSVATGMSLTEARDFVLRYKELRKPIFTYTQGLIDQARREGFVETIFGRRRPMPDIHSTNFVVRSAAERAAMNMPIQGTEADLMKMAMIEVQQKLPKGAKQLLQIHDSIIVECSEDQAKKVEHLLDTTMENIYPKLPIKLKVDVKSGKTWGDL